MLILAIDTSCRMARVVLVKDGVTVAKADIDDKRTHSVKLLPAIECLLSQNKLSVSDIDLIAVTNGPGSYTGLRIGVVTAKLLGYSENIPVVGVNTLDYIARSFEFDGIVLPLLDARNTRAYGCFYKNGQRLTEPFVRPVSETMECAKLYGDCKIFVCGDAVNNSEITDIIESTDKSVIFAGADYFGDSAVIARLAEEKYSKTDDKSVFDSANLNVDYMKDWY